MSQMPKAVVAWSSGKDAAWALDRVRREGSVEVVGLLTTVTETFARVSMHGVREALLRRQAGALGLSLRVVSIPWPCPNEAYEAAMGRAVAELRSDGVTHIVFGDLFLEDVRAYRESRLEGTGIAPIFPLWGEGTAALADAMLAGGVEAYLAVVDPRHLAPELAGARFDRALLERLPASVDPCGERGEFHTVVVDGPMFRERIPVTIGEVVTREGFVFADVVPSAG